MVSNITKEELSDLPAAHFDGRIIVVQTVKEVDAALAYLYQQTAVGFDTETRPAFKKGQKNKISLIQLASEDTCFLFRLNYIDFPESLITFLSDEKVAKIGLSLKDDFSAMKKRSSFMPKGFVDLQQMVQIYGISDQSLQKIYGILFGEKISKSQRLSNWDVDILSDAQKKYAALDAFACLKIYNKLKELNEE